jgi:hypothetical protein
LFIKSDFSSKFAPEFSGFGNNQLISEILISYTEAGLVHLSTGFHSWAYDIKSRQIGQAQFNPSQLIQTCDPSTFQAQTTVVI